MRVALHGCGRMLPFALITAGLAEGTAVLPPCLSAPGPGPVPGIDSYGSSEPVVVHASMLLD